MQLHTSLPAAFLTLATLFAPATNAQGGVTRYCQSGAAGATISATGSADFGVNGGSGDLVLHAAGLPLGAPGFFFYGSRAQPAAPFGNGFLCIGGGAALWRLGVVSVAPGAHEVSSAVDYLQPPQPAAQITPGSSWHFQFVFRVAGGFDTTDALRIQFVPPLSLAPVVTVAHVLRSGHPLGQLGGGGVVLMNTQAELQAFWDLHSIGFQPAPPLPPVDMTQSTVLAVFAGRRLTSGYDIDITDVALSVTSLHVSSAESIPCGGTLFSESNPMRMVAVRKIPGATLGSWTPTVLACP